MIKRKEAELKMFEEVVEPQARGIGIGCYCSQWVFIHC